PSRILMAPLTRGRATSDGVPTPLMAQYYAQRASAGLIVSEATGISREGLGWPNAPGLWNPQQVEQWTVVTEAVHAAGGRIVAQLWHMGRVVHPSVSGVRPISASATRAPGHAHTYEGNQDYVEARPATGDDIARILSDYAAAARRAIAAGFDGVQVHGANGYLIDQFLRDSSNLRADEYGGSIANRIRFLGEVVAAVAAEVGISRTGLRLSPNGAVNGVADSDGQALFTAAAKAMEELGLPWLELREPGPQSTFRPTDEPPASPAIRQVFSGKLVLNSDYRADSAAALIESGAADAISFGRPFIANPDLIDRLRTGTPLSRWDTSTFYSQGAAGYTDYPTATEQAAA
ncbi:MAG: alkene reductase, partial [Sphingomicrobium sp.]